MHRVPLKWAVGLLVLMILLALFGVEALWPIIGINALLLVVGLIRAFKD